jgi:hypothetical protein
MFKKLSLLLSLTTTMLIGWEPITIDTSLTSSWALNAHQAIIEKRFARAEDLILKFPYSKKQAIFYDYGTGDALLDAHILGKLFEKVEIEKESPRGFRIGFLELAIRFHAPTHFIEFLLPLEDTIYANTHINYRRVTFIANEYIPGKYDQWHMNEGVKIEIKTPLYAVIQQIHEIKEKIENATDEDLSALQSELQNAYATMQLLIAAGADIDHTLWEGHHLYYLGDYNNTTKVQGEWTQVAIP